MRKWVDELFIIIMDMLQDSSLLAKRQVSTMTSRVRGVLRDLVSLSRIHVPDST